MSREPAGSQSFYSWVPPNPSLFSLGFVYSPTGSLDTSLEFTVKVTACAFILFSPGAHIPIRSYKLSILIHPLTMETCGIAIAARVLVENPHIGIAKVTGNVAVCGAWLISKHTTGW